MDINFASITLSQLADLKARGARGEEATITFPFNTGLLVRNFARTIAFEVERRGFEIVHQTDDGGRLYRRHLIVYRGNAWEAVNLAMALTELAKREGDGDD